VKIEAHGHIIKVSESYHWATISLDGHCLLITERHGPSRKLLDALADKLAYALRAPERKKKPRVKKAPPP
jgi:hypothetical protein